MYINRVIQLIEIELHTIVCAEYNAILIKIFWSINTIDPHIVNMQRQAFMFAFIWVKYSGSFS